MSYIGKSPAVGNFVKLDAISTSSTNSYSLTLDSVAFVPESANHMLVSLNGVIQAPLTAFSVSGSTITFLPSSGTLSSSDSIDFIMVYGNVLDIGTPSDSTVTNAKTNFVSTSSSAGLQIKGDGTTDGTLQLNCSQNSHGIKLKSPAHSAGASYTLTFPTTDGNADEFLQTNGSGTLTWATAGGIENADTWRLSSNFTGSSGTINNNWEQADTYGYTPIGSSMTQSSGIFTFPSTGYYLILFNAYVDDPYVTNYAGVQLRITLNNSSYNTAEANYSSVPTNGYHKNMQIMYIADVTDVSNVKIKFDIHAGDSIRFAGNTSANFTSVKFIRLANT